PSEPPASSRPCVRPRRRVWRARIVGEPFLDFTVNRREPHQTAAGATTENCMLYWALMFFVVAIVACLLGFGGIAQASAGIAQLLFFIFLVLLIASLVMQFVRGRPYD